MNPEPGPEPGWRPGQVIPRREVLGLDPIPRPHPRPDWYGRSWLELPVHVVEAGPDQVVTYTPSGAPFTFPAHPGPTSAGPAHSGPTSAGGWPSPDGTHPWSGRTHWTGHGCLMIQRPGEHHAVWHLWDGPDRRLMCWYINLQTAFVRGPDGGYHTQDLELDFVVYPDGRWEIKDADVLDQRVAEGRFWPGLVDWLRAEADWYIERLDQGRWWWDESWAHWTPPPGWDRPPPDRPPPGDVPDSNP